MNHKIELTTTEVLLINKALRLDMQNEVDNDMSELLIEKLNRKVKKIKPCFMFLSQQEKTNL